MKTFPTSAAFIYEKVDFRLILTILTFLFVAPKLATQFLHSLKVLKRPFCKSDTKSSNLIFDPLRFCSCLSLVFTWTVFAFCCSFWFFVPTKSHSEQCDAQMETQMKNPQTSNKKS